MLGTSPIGSSPIASTGQSSLIYRLVVTSYITLESVIKKTSNKVLSSQLLANSGFSKRINKTIETAISQNSYYSKSVELIKYSHISLSTSLSKRVSATKTAVISLVSESNAITVLLDFWSKINSIYVLTKRDNERFKVSYLFQHSVALNKIEKQIISIKDYIKQKIRISNE